MIRGMTFTKKKIERIQNFLAVQPTSNFDRKTLSSPFVHDREHSKKSPVSSPARHVIATPAVVFCARTQSDSRPIVQPEAASFGLAALFSRCPDRDNLGGCSIFANDNLDGGAVSRGQATSARYQTTDGFSVGFARMLGMPLFRPLESPRSRWRFW